MRELPPPTGKVDYPHTRRLDRLRRLSYLLDSAIAIPGTGYRIGLDPLIGLLPGGGDTAGFVLSSFIILEAARMGASRSVLSQMVFNTLLETVLGTVPVVGDAFDVAWKSNRKNVQLLEEHLQVAPPSRSRHHGFAILLLLGLLLVTIASLAVSVLVIRWVVQHWPS